MAAIFSLFSRLNGHVNTKELLEIGLPDLFQQTSLLRVLAAFNKLIFLVTTDEPGICELLYE